MTSAPRTSRFGDKAVIAFPTPMPLADDPTKRCRDEVEQRVGFVAPLWLVVGSALCEVFREIPPTTYRPQAIVEHYNGRSWVQIR